MNMNLNAFGYAGGNFKKTASAGRFRTFTFASITDDLSVVSTSAHMDVGQPHFVGATPRQAIDAWCWRKFKKLGVRIDIDMPHDIAGSFTLLPIAVNQDCRYLAKHY